MTDLNSTKATRMLKTVHEYIHDTSMKVDTESCIIDALTDIMHLCIHAGYDFPDLIDTAMTHFREETLNEGIVQ